MFKTYPFRVRFLIIIVDRIGDQSASQQTTTDT